MHSFLLNPSQFVKLTPCKTTTLIERSFIKVALIMTRFFDENIQNKSSVEDDEELTKKLLEDTQPSKFNVEKSYKGPHLTLPLDKTQIANMIESFKLNKVIFFIFYEEPSTDLTSEVCSSLTT